MGWKRGPRRWRGEENLGAPAGRGYRRRRGEENLGAPAGRSHPAPAPITPEQEEERLQEQRFYGAHRGVTATLAKQRQRKIAGAHLDPGTMVWPEGIVGVGTPLVGPTGGGVRELRCSLCWARGVLHDGGRPEGSLWYPMGLRLGAGELLWGVVEGPHMEGK